MSNFSVTVTDETGLYGAMSGLIVANTIAAAELWQAVLQRQASIEISITITGLRPGVLAQAFSPGSGQVGTYAGYRLLQSGMAYELQTGVDPNGAEPDVDIDLNATSLASVWFDPTPQRDDGDVPATSFDAISLLQHEIGHALGFTGYRDNFTGALAGTAMSLYDRYIEIGPSGPFFAGPNAVAVYGSPVPLAFGSLAHYGNFGGQDVTWWTT